MLDNCTLAIILTNSGGDGKTAWTEALTCLAEIVGKSPLVIDSDGGNQCFMNRSGAHAALDLLWSERFTPLGQTEKWLAEQLETHQMIIVDTGANFLVTSHNGSQVLNELITAALKVGVEVVFYAINGTNKAGSSRLCEAIREKFGQNFKVVTVLNNRDGSGAYYQGPEAQGFPVIEMGHLQPGFQAYRLSRQEPLLDILRNPSPGYELATARMAKWLQDILHNQEVRAIIGDGADDELSALSKANPGWTKMVSYKLADVTNGKLLANAELSAAATGFNRASPENESAFLDAAKKLWDKEKAYRAAK